MAKPKLISVVKSTRKGKRYKATFDDGKAVHFGQANPTYGAYIDHQDETKRQAYIARHSKNNEDWKNPQTAGALSRFLLWETPSLASAVKTYNKRFKDEPRPSHQA